MSAQWKRQSREIMGRNKLTVALVGAGKLAGFLVPALAEAGYRVTEIVTREQRGSMMPARALARPVGAQVATVRAASLDADVVWFAVPDSEIGRAAEKVARRMEEMGAKSPRPRFGFHSSGAVGSRKLDSLRRAGVAVASVHPLMTFVGGAPPSLRQVPFAVEGDTAAVRLARRMVRELGGESFVLAEKQKAAYHAWATMTSPLFLAYLVALEEAAREAGLGRKEARRMSLPIVRQTIENYARRGPAKSFSGPFIRGDVETVEKHLALLKRSPKVQAVYAALARVALDGLPVRNRGKLSRLLE